MLAEGERLNHLYQTFKGTVVENAPAVTAVALVRTNCAVKAIRSVGLTLGAVEPDNSVP